MADSARVRRVALVLLAGSSAAALVALLVPGPAADWAFALSSALLPISLMTLGAAGRRGLGAARWTLGALLGVLAAAAAAVLALSAAPGGATVAGFPLAAVVQVVGFWLLPLPIATLGYALAFDRTGVTHRDLEELRARAARSSPSTEPSGRG